MKKIYFLSGYSRAGNTFLSSILNQNKNITVTPNSCVVQIMYSLFELYKSFKILLDSSTSPSRYLAVAKISFGLILSGLIKIDFSE